MTTDDISSAEAAAPLLAERLAAACLCAAIVAGPIALGGTPIWARLALEAAMASACVLWSLSGRRSLWLTLPPLAVAVIACLQIVPLPDLLLRLVAPLPAAAWRAAAASGWGSVSVDPGVTATGIRRLLLGLATIAVTADLGRNGVLRRWLMGAMAAAAVCIWALGIAFPVDSKQRILLGCVDLKGPIAFWKTEVVEPVQTGGTGTYEIVPVGEVQHEMPAWSIGDGFGSYVISNHFAAGMYLTVPFALALWLFATRRRIPDAARVGIAVAAIAAATWTVGPLADSRAGAASMLLAGLMLLNLAAEQKLWRRITGLAVAGYAAVLVTFCLAFFGPWTGVQQLLPEGVRQQIRSLRGDGRVVATRVAGQMLVESPLLGTGLDTFGELQPSFLGNVFLLHYAHNDYVQLLAETGLVGGAIAAAVGGLLIARSRRFRREAQPPLRCLDAGPWAALAALSLHSAFDWNLHIPANALLAAIATGLAVSSRGSARDAALGSPSRERPDMSPGFRPGLPLEGFRPGLSGSRVASLTLALASLLALAFLARDAASTAARRDLATAIVAARTSHDPQSPAPVPQLAAAITAGERAAGRDPSDAKLAILIGQAHLHLAARTAGPDDSSPAAPAAQAWFERARRACAVCKGLPTSIHAAGKPQ